MFLFYEPNQSKYLCVLLLYFLFSFNSHLFYHLSNDLDSNSEGKTKTHPRLPLQHCFLFYLIQTRNAFHTGSLVMSWQHNNTFFFLSKPCILLFILSWSYENKCFVLFSAEQSPLFLIENTAACSLSKSSRWWVWPFYFLFTWGAPRVKTILILKQENTKTWWSSFPCISNNCSPYVLHSCRCSRIKNVTFKQTVSS